MTADSARAGLDRPDPGTWSDEEFLLRFGDLIDDRIAETWMNCSRNAPRDRAGGSRGCWGPATAIVSG